MKALLRSLLVSKGNSFCIFFKYSDLFTDFSTYFSDMLFKISFVINCYAKRFHCVGYGKLWLVTPEHWLIISSFVFSQHHRLVFWTVPLHTISRKPIISNSSIKLDFYMSPLLSSFRCDMAPHHPNLVMIQTLLLFKCKLLCYHGHLQPHSKSKA